LPEQLENSLFSRREKEGENLNEGIIAALVIFGLMALGSFVQYIDKKKPKLKGVQIRAEVYQKNYKKRKPSIKKAITNILKRLYNERTVM
jgi:hypothetical protein